MRRFENIIYYEQRRVSRRTTPCCWKKIKIQQQQISRRTDSLKYYVWSQSLPRKHKCRNGHTIWFLSWLTFPLKLEKVWSQGSWIETRLGCRGIFHQRRKNSRSSEWQTKYRYPNWL